MRKLGLLVISLVLLVGFVGAQGNKRITGKVTDTNGEILSGVTVSEVGGKAKTMTDEKGNYSIQLGQSANTLRFSFVGFQDADAKIGFWAATPCDQAAALTTAQATISYVAAVANTYVIGIVSMQSIGFGFVGVTAGSTLLYAVQNAQVRALELEAALNAVGLLAT